MVETKSLIQKHAFTVITTVVVAAVLLAIPGIVGNAMTGNLIVCLYYVVLASCWNMLAGYIGQFSIAQPAFAAIGAYASGLSVSHLGLPVPLGILAGAIFAGIVGSIVGFIFLRLSSIYFAVATWAFAGSLQVFLSMAADLTGGNNGLAVTPLFQDLDPTRYYYAFLALAAFSVGIIAIMVKSRSGVMFGAIKGDELRASTLGMNITLWKTAAFAITSALSGAAGALYGHYVIVLAPTMTDFTISVLVIVMVVAGGVATLSGPVFGAIAVGLLSLYLQKYGGWNLMIFGLLIIVVTRLARQGLVPLAMSSLRRLFRRRPNEELESLAVPETLEAPELTGSTSDRKRT